MVAPVIATHHVVANHQVVQMRQLEKKLGPIGKINIEDNSRMFHIFLAENPPPRIPRMSNSVLGGNGNIS